MARIENKNLKIFASDASNNGVFGSAADNTKILSNDVEVLQSKPAWEDGWEEAVIGTRKFPTLEEFQSCNYINTSFISYIIQEGIPEWNEDKTYYQNSIVKRTGTYEIYGSKTDDNTGNALPDGVSDDEWEFLQDLAITAIPDATTSVKGIAMLATIADVIAANTTKIVTPDLLTQYGFTTGDVKATTRPTLQAGWVWAAGTIGNASSGATRANSDTEDLFNLYWNATEYNYAGTNASGAALQVYDSSGNAVAKGVSAAADWGANRRISVVDLRDRAIAGRGDMVGNAGRLSGQTGGVSGNGLGNSGGTETHTLTAAQNGPHQHQWWGSGGSGSPKSFALFVDQSSGGLGSLRSADAIVESGEGSPHNNVQPTIICNYVIKL
jgi:hypothetical protein